MRPIIKWPGGKSGEIAEIEPLIPSYNRYIEPFFGGGALFFHLAPEAAVINDISESLMQYYKLIKAQDKKLYELLVCYSNSFNNFSLLFVISFFLLEFYRDPVAFPVTAVTPATRKAENTQY